MNLPGSSKPWLEAPVAVFGAGVSGLAVVDFVEMMGGSAIVFDARGGDYQPEFTESDAAKYSTVIASPGFAANHPWMILAHKANSEIIGELDLASLFWKGKVLAVTGTNGKTTLVEFITHSMKYVGLEAYSVGNIGFPFAKLLCSVNEEDAWAVVEVSSFQAELMKYFKSDIVIWSNLSEDHLDRYETMDEYFNAKLNLLKVSDPKITFFGKETGKYFEKQGEPIPENAWVLDPYHLRYPNNSPFALRPQRENFQLASSIFRTLGYDPEVLFETVKSFRLSEHRLRMVDVIEGVEFWNDSKATNFSATEAALKQFNGKVCWVGGGRKKGGKIKEFARRISPRIRKAFVTGDTGKTLGKGFDSSDVRWEFYETIEEAIQAAYLEAGSRGVVLFSPGFASQKPFQNYIERGICFEHFVKDLKLGAKIIS